MEFLLNMFGEEQASQIDNLIEVNEQEEVVEEDNCIEFELDEETNIFNLAVFH